MATGRQDCTANHPQFFPEETPTFRSSNPSNFRDFTSHRGSWFSNHCLTCGSRQSRELIIFFLHISPPCRPITSKRNSTTRRGRRPSGDSPSESIVLCFLSQPSMTVRFLWAFFFVHLAVVKGITPYCGPGNLA